jgi:orotate phosphoribosyltransferase
MPVLYAAADIKVEALIISVDRMEKGIGNLTATEEIEKEFGIKTFSIVNVDDIKTN